MTFEEKVRSMDAYSIIMAMVEGLENPAVEVDMDTFGSVKDGKCFGCAATNAVCKVSGVSLDAGVLGRRETRADTVGSGFDFLYGFESAIDCLRDGSIRIYNLYGQTYGLAQIIPKPGLSLPRLLTDNYLENLAPYRELAEYQREANV